MVVITQLRPFFLHIRLPKNYNIKLPEIKNNEHKDVFVSDFHI